MKELRRIKPPLVYFLRFSRRKATSSTSNFFAETQVFFSGGPTGQAVVRDSRSYGAGSPPRAGMDGPGRLRFLDPRRFRIRCVSQV